MKKLIKGLGLVLSLLMIMNINVMASDQNTNTCMLLMNGNTTTIIGNNGNPISKAYKATKYDTNYRCMRDSRLNTGMVVGGNVFNSSGKYLYTLSSQIRKRLDSNYYKIVRVLNNGNLYLESTIPEFHPAILIDRYNKVIKWVTDSISKGFAWQDYAEGRKNKKDVVININNKIISPRISDGVRFGSVIENKYYFSVKNLDNKKIRFTIYKVNGIKIFSKDIDAAYHKIDYVYMGQKNIVLVLPKMLSEDSECRIISLDYKGKVIKDTTYTELNIDHNGTAYFEDDTDTTFNIVDGKFVIECNDNAYIFDANTLKIVNTIKAYTPTLLYKGYLVDSYGDRIYDLNGKWYTRDLYFDDNSATIMDFNGTIVRYTLYSEKNKKEHFYNIVTRKFIK